MTTLDQSQMSATVRRAYLTIERMQRRLDEYERSRSEPVAIVGLGCRFPGGAVDADSYWQVLRSGTDAVAEIPPDRWDVDAFYDKRPQRPGKMSTRWGGFLDRVDEFDHAFFGISRREAVSMDPQQRLALEVAWEALENAGQAPSGLAGSRTGVFMGVCSNDFATVNFQHPLDVSAYVSTGTAHSVLTGRISYLLDLRGPSVALDSACSSSLVAVHLAAQSLRAGECDLALGGGVNVVLSPLPGVAFSQFPGMVSPDGRCRTFDAAANGYVRSEGCGMVVLKRLSDAVRDGDDVLAVLRGGAVNQDGRSSGVTAPNGLAQRDVLRRALAASGVEPHEVSYIEAHGTGTRLGDPIEVEALADVYGRSEGGPVYLGSAKTNIGHPEAAAGIAGLIKVVLALGHGTIPPNVHFNQLNPHLSLTGTTFAVPRELTPWPGPADRRVAGVSSFGFSGTNAHLILAAAPPRPEPAGAAPADPGTRPLSVLALSGKTGPAVVKLAARYAERLAADPDVSLADVCFSANTGRSHFPHRLAAVAGTAGELAAQLTDFVDGLPVDEPVTGTAGGADVVFLFPGQGPQRAGMARSLYETQPTFRRVLDDCAEILRPMLPVPLLSVLFPTDPDSDLINRTAYAQPALFAVEYALAQLWRSWGVEPVAVLGHSFGEYVAACVAGAVGLEDGLRLAVERARLMDTLSRTGSMATVFASEDEVAAVIAGWSDRISIAAVNGPANTTISGEQDLVASVCDTFLSRGVRAKPLHITTSSHSPLIEPILEPLYRIAGQARFASPRIPLVSNVTGELWPWDEAPDAEYWCRHARRPVLFAAGIATLQAMGYRNFVEVGPAPTLLGLVGEALPADAAGLLLPSLRPNQEDWPVILSGLAQLYVHGADVNWRGFDRDYARTRVPVPTYPFERTRCWPERRHQPVPSTWDGAAAAPDGVDAAGDVDDADLVYRLTWEPAGPAFTAPSTVAGAKETWLVLADETGVGDELAALVAQRGSRCVRVVPGPAYRYERAGEAVVPLDTPEHLLRLLDDLDLAADESLQVVHLRSVRDRATEPDTVEGLLQEQWDGCMSAIHLAQALARAGGTRPTRLWLVTRGAVQPGEAGPTALAVGQSTLWGLGRSLQQEHTALWGGLVDLDPGAEPRSLAAQLLGEIAHRDGEDQIALRDGHRHVARLVRGQLPDPPAPGTVWRPDASYLITGGLGGVGSAVARSMVRAGARRLVLVGRTPIPPRRDWADLAADDPAGQRVATIRELESLGASVIVESLDVSDEHAVREFIERFDREGWPPIRGVVHAAGVGDVAPLVDLRPADLEQHLRPKAVGAWVLHRLLGDRPLDFFVLFSSTSSILSSPFVASYAAANAFLDSLAQLRRNAGKPALTINWGIWSQTGLAARGANATPGLSRGMGTLIPEQALRIFHRLLAHGDAQVAVMPVDWSDWGRRYRDVSGSALLARLLDGHDGARSGKAARRSALPSRADLLARPPDQRAPALTEALVPSITATLGGKSSTVGLDHPLIDLGLDSLMAVELKNEVESRLGVALPISVLLDRATVRTLVAHIVTELSTVDGDSTPVAIPRVQRVDDVAERLLAQLEEQAS